MKLAVIISFIPLLLFSQLDSLKGNVKSVREKMIYLEKEVQLPKTKGMIEIKIEYGEGFLLPESRISIVNKEWFHYPSVCYINYYREYNEKKLMAETWFYKDGSQYGKLAYKYDKKNNLIQRKRIFYNSYTDMNFSYNFENKWVSSLYYQSDDPNQYSYAYNIYNEQGLIKEVKSFDEEGESSGTKFEYDHHGNKIKLIGHSPYVTTNYPDGSSKSARNNIGVDHIREEYFYDQFDNVSEIKKYSFQDDKSYLRSKTTYEYDSLNRKVSESIGKDSVNIIRKYKYSEDNLLIEETYTNVADSSKNRKITIFYNSDKNVVKTIYKHNETETILDFKYKFDRNNNWTEQTKYVNQKPQYIRKRKIKYY